MISTIFKLADTKLFPPYLKTNFVVSIRIQIASLNFKAYASFFQPENEIRSIIIDYSIVHLFTQVVKQKLTRDGEQFLSHFP